jgi:crotonobetainyl-CoA:carnitine CoA-transferase CaiB-like acyl-CoA transferase
VDLSRVLDGVTVLSLAEQFPGPLCTRLLADLGAEVIQLERPGGGDPQRQANPWLFRFAGLGKKSVALDLKDATAFAAARKLAERCDVLVEGFRPGVMSRLNLSYEDVRSFNPKVVYCSISGYGQDGPYRDLTGHNINYEAISGYLEPYAGTGYEYFTGGPPWGDVLSGSLAASGILAALRKAEQTGTGAFLDISITDSLAFGLGGVLTRHVNHGETWPLREGGYGLFRCTDGYLALGIAHEDYFWRALCRLLEIEQYAGLDHAQRIAQRDELREAIGARLARHPVGYWMETMGEEVPCSPVNRVSDVAADPQIVERNLFIEALDEGGSPFTTLRSLFGGADPGRHSVPALGRDTRDVLASLGLAEGEIEDILSPADRIVATPVPPR